MPLGRWFRRRHRQQLENMQREVTVNKLDDFIGVGPEWRTVVPSTYQHAVRRIKKRMETLTRWRRK